jgi:hypothetical protein
MSQMPQLRQQLVDAAARTYKTTSTPTARRLQTVWRTASAVAAAAITIGVAAVVVILAGSRSHERTGTTTTTQRPTWSQRLQASRRALINELAPLRRPQTQAERAFARTLNRHQSPFEEFYGTPDRSLVRYATRTPWGERLYLVPITPWTPRQILARAGPSVHAVPASENIVAYSRTRGEAAFGDAARIRQGTSGGGEAGTIAHGVWKTTRLFALVPDGVAKVTWVLPRQPGGSTYGYRTYPRLRYLTAIVHGNIAAAATSRQLGSKWVMIWYAPDGHVLRHFGSIAAARRVVAVNQPGPQTAKSRAAQRDPSTPNHVWVTPAAGGPHNLFVLHFRVLLNDATYAFRVSGPNCPAYQFAGGYSQPTGPRGNQRGDLLNARLVVFPGRALCRGTYRVSARVNGLETIGPKPGRKINAKPFGSAKFTVR